MTAEAPRRERIAGTTFPAFGTTVGVWVTPAQHIATAERVLRAWVSAVDAACSRFRADSDLSRVNTAAGRTVRVSPVLMEALGAAIAMAELTEGFCDPTLGDAVIAAGYDRPLELMPAHVVSRPYQAVSRHGTHGWRRIAVDTARSEITTPPGVILDLGASCKGWAVDQALRYILDTLHDPDAGVCVSAGGDLGVTGAGMPGGWPVRLSDCLDSTPSGADSWVRLRAGGLASSGALRRRWYTNGAAMHHLIDPRNGRPARSCWRMVTVQTHSALAADSTATAAYLMGESAIGWLQARSCQARLIRDGGDIVATGGGLAHCTAPVTA